MGTLYLIPNLLGDSGLHGAIPVGVQEIIRGIKVFAVEEARNARRYLKQIDKRVVIDQLEFLELDEHSSRMQVASCLTRLEREDVGIISGAGCPGIADPGAELVALAHASGYRVSPLVGPSSILLALIASGCNGQRFSFNGYLPVRRDERVKALRAYERESAAECRTQLFIETPYRNAVLLADMLETLSASTLLSIASDISLPGEFIRSLPVGEWRLARPSLEKRPTVFTFLARR
ncbi:MAG: SAM-dependent methyltransferase [Odoribacteraceae bacterium]|jgi:16S rRNA (cytidine1402-2'-O)-methyltransferase|nr:SAM-dependent methyltransferase [Odoribacteraceae bacterium]